MPSFRTTRRVSHTPDQMFDLVADVEEYPDFLPLCTGLRVLKRLKDDTGRDVLVAEMSIGYKAIAERFTTKVTLDRPKRDILVSYVNGPFKYLENRWEFRPDASHPDGGGCDVHFAIEYEFRSLTLGILMGAMFDQAFRRFTDAFERRADRIYGPAPSAGATA